MRGLTFGGPGVVRVESVPDPSIQQPGDAVLRVRLTAVCGSDLHSMLQVAERWSLEGP